MHGHAHDFLNIENSLTPIYESGFVHTCVWLVHYILMSHTHPHVTLLVVYCTRREHNAHEKHLIVMKYCQEGVLCKCAGDMIAEYNSQYVNIIIILLL
jgi:hypothetical protein